MADLWTELRRLARVQEDQATTQARAGEHLAGLNKDFGALAADHRRFVMDPEKGVIVRTDRQDKEIKILEGHLSRVQSDVNALRGLPARVKALEDAAAARAATKRWGFREVLVPLLVTIAGSVGSTLLVLWLTGSLG